MTGDFPPDVLEKFRRGAKAIAQSEFKKKLTKHVQTAVKSSKLFVRSQVVHIG